MSPEEILDFIIGEIPFYIFFAILMYFIWVRPKRKKKREASEKFREPEVGDEVLFADGMIGILENAKNGTVYIESGSHNDKYRISVDCYRENLSAQERIKENYEKKSFWQKLLYKL